MACLTIAYGERREAAEIFSSRLSMAGGRVMAFMAFLVKHTIDELYAKETVREFQDCCVTVG